MEGVTKIISFAVTLGIALAGIGQLPAATHWLMVQVAQAPPQMISLVKLNHALLHPLPVRHVRARKP